MRRPLIVVADGGTAAGPELAAALERAAGRIATVVRAAGPGLARATLGRAREAGLRPALVLASRPVATSLARDGGSLPLLVVPGRRGRPAAGAPAGATVLADDDPSRVVPHVLRRLARHLAGDPDLRYYEFRRVREPGELRDHFRVRYEAYLGTRMEPFLTPNPDHLDIDPWDTHARHYSLYEVRGRSAVPAGALRFITIPESPAAPVVRDLLRRSSRGRRATPPPPRRRSPA